MNKIPTPVIVEYLLIVDTNDTFCRDSNALENLLGLDSSLEVDGTKLTHEGFSCEFLIHSGQTTKGSQRYFQLRFTANACESDDDYVSFSSLLHVVKKVMKKLGNRPETLVDDISFYYSSKAYEQIHRIENLMRRLIANFMLITVGSTWEKDSIPPDVRDAADKRSRSDYLSVLYKLDFIHLAALLLKPYSTATNDQLLKKIGESATVEDLTSLKAMLPESNWNRYFNAIVDCKDTFLNEHWGKLYEFRCMVAHNSLFTKGDFDKTVAEIAKIEPKLLAAIEKLPQVTIPDIELEAVKDNVEGSVLQTLQYSPEGMNALKELAAQSATEVDALREFLRRSPDGPGVFRSPLDELLRQPSPLRSLFGDLPNPSSIISQELKHDLDRHREPFETAKQPDVTPLHELHTPSNPGPNKGSD
jgi:hypothetical protein